MKKSVLIFFVLIYICLLSGCQTKAEKEPTPEVVNPLQESSDKEIIDTLGMNLNVPEDAQNISYFIIEIAEVNSTAQAMFTRDIVDYTYRIRSTTEFEDISGAYYEWETIKEIEISYCSGEVRFNEGKEGICLWYDTVPGLMYSIYATSGASEEGLLSIAYELYVPAEDVD
jgi:hypothetical protein